jgi:hypothetical protein
MFTNILFADGSSWIPASTDRLGLRSDSAARRHWNQIRSHSNVSLPGFVFIFFYSSFFSRVITVPPFLVAMT